MTAKIYDFEQEAKKRGYVRMVTYGDMVECDYVQNSTFVHCGNIESHGTIDLDSIIIIQGQITLGDNDV